MAVRSLPFALAVDPTVLVAATPGAAAAGIGAVSALRCPRGRVEFRLSGRELCLGALHGVPPGLAAASWGGGGAPQPAAAGVASVQAVVVWVGTALAVIQRRARRHTTSAAQAPLEGSRSRPSSARR